MQNNGKNVKLKVNFNVKLAMKIGALSKLTGLTASSIRFYESSGLIVSVRRQDNGYREYQAETVEFLHVIKCGQQLGFSLDEIKSMLPVDRAAGWQSDTLVAGLRRKLLEVEGLQARLIQTRQQLVDLIQKLETQPNGLTCDDMNAIRELSST